jgi:hypothetical protein
LVCSRFHPFGGVAYLRRRRGSDRTGPVFGRLFLLTFLFMGPLGVAVALIMNAIADYAPAPEHTPAPPKPASAAQKVSKVGDRVMVVMVDDPGDEYAGKVGVIDEITGETDGYNLYSHSATIPEPTHTAEAS